MNKRKISLEELHSILYEILYAFDDYCKEHNLSYHLTGGTLLGAVRHNGIIPWDDDIDVMMERPEYERFISIATKNPPKGYELYCIQNTKGFFEPMAKLGKKNTLLFEAVPWMPPKGLGINIDIIPVDGCPDDYEQAKKYAVDSSNNNLYLTGHLLGDYDLKESGLNVVTAYLIRKCHFLSKQFFIRLFNKNKRIPIRSTKYYGCICWGLYGEGEVQPCSDLDETIYIKFGERELPVLKNYERYLKGVYGDYMQLPPEDKRQPKHESNAFVWEE